MVESHTVCFWKFLQITVLVRQLLQMTRIKNKDGKEDGIMKMQEYIDEAEKALFLSENARRFYAFDDLSVPDKIKNMAED